MGADKPKQYLPLAGRPIIEHTVRSLFRHGAIAGVMVVTAADDTWWPEVEAPGALRCDGGQERCHSVLNGLQALLEVQAVAEDWALVHDAARPLLASVDVDRLIDAVGDGDDGGLLGVPVRDTMKRTDDDGVIQQTVAREYLWHALTPQMFRIGPLISAIRQCLEQDRLVTDESQAMELCGAHPKMVQGSPDNIKITRPDDLQLAERLLEAACA